MNRQPKNKRNEEIENINQKEKTQDKLKRLLDNHQAWYIFIKKQIVKCHKRKKKKQQQFYKEKLKEVQHKKIITKYRVQKLHRYLRHKRAKKTREIRDWVKRNLQYEVKEITIE